MDRVLRSYSVNGRLLAECQLPGKDAASSMLCLCGSHGDDDVVVTGGKLGSVVLWAPSSLMQLAQWTLPGAVAGLAEVHGSGALVAACESGAIFFFPRPAILL